MGQQFQKGAFCVLRIDHIRKHSVAKGGRVSHCQRRKDEQEH